MSHDTAVAELPALAAPPATATFGARALAVVVDTSLLGLVTWVVAPGAVAPSLWPGLGAREPSTPPEVASVSSGPPVAVLVAVLVLAALQAWTGATVGKRALGIVVVDGDTGRPVGMLRTVWRQVLHLADAILLVGYLRPLWEARRRTFADSLARTVVVVSPWRPPWGGGATSDRWSRGIALGLTALALAGALPVAGATTVDVVDQPCVVTQGPVGAEATVRVTVHRSWETRLGVRRDVPHGPAPWEVAWRVGTAALDGAAVAASHDDVRVDAQVRVVAGAADGSTWSGSTSATTQDVGDGTVEHLGVVGRDAEPVDGTYEVTSDLVVDGTTVATCVTSVVLDPADLAAAGR